MRKRVGDTLVEVTIAIGIFSMVAIAAAAIMSSGTSESQTSLEATLAREEIDAQADALRFIHDSYITSKDTSSNDSNKGVYAALWKSITGNAIIAKDFDAAFTPSTCQAIYNDTSSQYSIYSQNAFILNPKQLDSESAFVSAKYGGNFQPATTYPRLLYGNTSNEAQGNLFNSSSSLSRIEGIFIVAVKDEGTGIVTTTEYAEDALAFYDFYIRTCWYGTSSETPSTISTVIRLYNPDLQTPTGTGSNIGNGYYTLRPFNLPSGITQQQTEAEYDYFWCVRHNANPSRGDHILSSELTSGEEGSCPAGFAYIEATDRYPRPVEDDLEFLPVYYQVRYTFHYESNGAPGSFPDQECTLADDTPCNAYAVAATPGYRFDGWCTKSIGPDQSCTGTAYDSNFDYKKNNVIVSGGNKRRIITLYATWIAEYNLIFYNTDGTTELKSCSQKKDANSHFTINCDTSLITNPGHGESFQGWSPNDREPYYSNGQTIDLNNIGSTEAHTLRLYPVWRVSVKFSSEGWIPHASGYSDCQIFNYTNPGYGRFVRKGTYYGGGYTPADGYLVSGGKNIEILDEGIINMQGYCYRSANDYVSYEIGKDDTFELSADMNTAGMRTHPGGYASISIGPITATINSGNITSSCQSSSGSTDTGSTYRFSSGSVIRLKIEKHSNDYSVSVNGTELKSCTVDRNDVSVQYRMYHYSHACSEIFNVQLFNIDMQQYKK